MLGRGSRHGLAGPGQRTSEDTREVRVRRVPHRESIRPGEFATLLESRGFESLFYPDHTHIPAMTPERDDVLGLAPEFRNGLDPFVALAAAEAITTLNIGTAVALVTERDPLVTAKTVASLDVLSNGRMHFGVGPGWILEELRNHGVAPEDRWAVQRERVEAMREIWTNDIAHYHGRFVSVARSRPGRNRYATRTHRSCGR